jgi:hypothetical protein
VRTTLNINEELLKKAQVLTNIKEKTALINLGLMQLIEKYSLNRLIKLGASEKGLKPIPRRRPQ